MKFFKQLALKFLQLRYRNPQVTVVLRDGNVDSVWFSRQRAEDHINRVRIATKGSGADFVFSIADSLPGGNYILDAQSGVWTKWNS